jgi:pyruvate dehydrogenase E1 component
MGEGLQHQDGHSHLAAATVPNILSYDPAYAYEVALIVQDGIRRMYYDGESIFYYLTLGNENYPMEPMPEGCREGVLKGMYRFRPSALKGAKVKTKVHLLGSGALLREALKAQEALAEKYGVAADVWSVTSYGELYRDGHAVERWNLLHPDQPARVPHVTECLKSAPGVLVAASDYVKALPDSIDKWLPRPLHALGTDGFGRSDSRAALRDFFEVDARFVVLSALAALAREGQIEPAVVLQAMQSFNISPDKRNPATS